MSEPIFEILPTLIFTPPVAVLEIGAANGWDTQKIYDCIKPIDYFAFEPDSRNIDSFKAQDVSRYKEVQLFQCAVGAVNSIQEFNASTGYNPHFQCDHTLSGSLKTPKKHLEVFPHAEFKYKINVRVIRLDDFIDLFSIPSIGFIWCDVQGAEDLVIQGGQKALSRTKYLFTEYYEEEMYEGQIGAEEIYRRLPGNWEVMNKWEADILFRNLNVE